MILLQAFTYFQKNRLCCTKKITKIKILLKKTSNKIVDQTQNLNDWILVKMITGHSDLSSLPSVDNITNKK